MASSFRSKRVRRQPERYGNFGRFEDEEVNSSSEAEEQRPRFRRQRWRAAADARSDDEDNAEMDYAQDMEEGFNGKESIVEKETGEGCSGRKAAPARGGSAAGSGRGLGSVRERAAAPAHPVSPSSFLAVLHACPVLLEFLLSPDALRTVTLVARDAASLAVALGAGPEVTAEWWRMVAAKHAPPGSTITADTPAAEVLAVAQQAVREDPARIQSCPMSTAKSKYRLSDKDLEDLPFEERPNRLFLDSAQLTRLHIDLDCRAAAHRKWGCFECIEAARLQAQAVAARVKATRGSREDQRRGEMVVALKRAGLDPSSSTLQRFKEVNSFVKRGLGNAASVAAAIAAAYQAEKEKEEREDKLAARLLKEGLNASEITSIQARSFIEGSSAVRLSAVVAAIKEEKEHRDGILRRRRALLKLLQLEGIGYCFWGCPEAEAYVYLGTGTARKAAAAYEAQRDAEQQRAARRQRIEERMAAEQLPKEFGSLPAVDEYIWGNTGSEEAAMQAARARHASQLACEQRCANIRQRLMAEGIPGAARWDVPDVQSYVDGRISEHDALAAASRWRVRKAQLEEAAKAAGMSADYGAVYLPNVRAFLAGKGSLEGAMQSLSVVEARCQREASATAALAAEGIPGDYVHRLELTGYINEAEGTLEEALQRARERHASMQAGQRRLERMERLLEQYGIAVQQYRYSVPALDAYLYGSTGDEQTAVLAVRAEQNRREAGWVQPPDQYWW